MTFTPLAVSDLDLTSWTFPEQVLFNGAMTGIVYGILAIGIVLIYRSNRVINFAYGEVGALAATLLAKLVLDWGWSFWPALLLVTLAGAALSAIIELTVVRRLFDAPRVILFVATLGVTQLVLLLQLVLPQRESLDLYPTAFDGGFSVGSVDVRATHLLVLVVVPAVTVALAWFLARTRAGMAIRAAAANPEAATLAGVSPRRMSTLVWTIAGALAAVTAVVVAPLSSTGSSIQAQGAGPNLLLRALAAALIGGMASLPWTLVGGVIIGVVEASLYFNVVTTPSTIEMFLFVLVVALVLLRRTLTEGEASGTGSWSFAPRTRAIPERLRDVAWVRRLPRLGALAGLLLAVALPFVVGAASDQFLYSRMLLFAVVALSVTVLTGWAGQLSLGQFAFVGLGAFAAAALVENGVGFVGAVLLAGVAGGAVAFVIGLPALRTKGLFLAVVTLAFAVAAASWILTRPVFLDDSGAATVPRADPLGIDLRSQQTYYFLCLGVLVVVVLVVANLRRSGVGRRIIAVRENERAASVLGVSPARAKLTAFALSGVLCGVAGGMFAGLFVQFGVSSFPVEASLQVVAIAVIGGLGSIAGAILGTLWVIGLPALFGDDPNVALLTSGAGLLILLMYFPGGLVGIVYAARDQLLAFADKRLRSRPAPPVSTSPRPTAPIGHRPEAPRSDVALRVAEVTVRFGGITAVDDVGLDVQSGEIVGLIGANGAGKSTLMNAISGLVPASGRVELFGADITHRSATRRATLGLGRTFQGAELFPDLSVHETISVALERRHPTRFWPSALGLPNALRLGRRQRDDANNLLGYLGLGAYADSFVGDLSTGTRRITELACLLALDARMLCLDEPTAGLAQRETEAFGPLLLRIRDELDASLLVIEHDMPLIMSISDRVVCLEGGRVIASGLPGDVRDDARVVASYLGTDERAIARSGARRTAEPTTTTTTTTTTATTHEGP